jgi:hypothetical protein
MQFKQIDLAHVCVKPSDKLNMNGDTVPKRSKQKKSGSFFDSSDEEEEESEVFDDSIYEKLINRPEFKNADTIVRMDASGNVI